MLIDTQVCVKDYENQQRPKVRVDSSLYFSFYLPTYPLWTVKINKPVIVSIKGVSVYLELPCLLDAAAEAID